MKSIPFALLVVACLCTTGQTQNNLGFKAVGVKAGYIVPDNIDETIGVGVVADLGSIDMFDLSAYVDYWSKNFTKNEYWDWQWDVLSVAVVGQYEFKLKSPIRPYVGAGIGFDVTHWKSEDKSPRLGIDYVNDRTATESDFDLAVHLLGGASYAVSPPLDAFLEVKYTTGGIDYVGVYIGLMYKL